jgi:hypothetical protein
MGVMIVSSILFPPDALLKNLWIKNDVHHHLANLFPTALIARQPHLPGDLVADFGGGAVGSQQLDCPVDIPQFIGDDLAELSGQPKRGVVDPGGGGRHDDRLPFFPSRCRPVI